MAVVATSSNREIPGFDHLVRMTDAAPPPAARPGVKAAQPEAASSGHNNPTTSAAPQELDRRQRLLNLPPAPTFSAVNAIQSSVHVLPSKSIAQDESRSEAKGDRSKSIRPETEVSPAPPLVPTQEISPSAATQKQQSSDPTILSPSSPTTKKQQHHHHHHPHHHPPPHQRQHHLTFSTSFPPPPAPAYSRYSTSPDERRLSSASQVRPAAAMPDTKSPSNSQEVSPTTTSPQKRKRTPSPERDADNRSSYEQQRGAPAAQSPTDHPMSAGTDDGPPREAESPRHAYPPPQDIYHQPATEAYPPPPQSQHAYPPPPEHRGNDAGPYARQNGYDPPLDPSIAPSQERPYYSESHLAEALQRENRAYDAQMPHRDSYDDSSPVQQHSPPEGLRDVEGPGYSTYGGTREAQGGPDSDRKRRKRIFSNRTKTGCMTCRRRKKKCDEQHPECNNCLRGGFVCEGYTVRNTWQKPAQVKQPVPLQSKNGYPPPPESPAGRAPYPAASRYQDVTPEFPRGVAPTGEPNRPPYEYRRGSVAEEGNYPSGSPSSHKGSVAYPAATPGQDIPPGSLDRSASVSSQHSHPAGASNVKLTPPSQAQAAAQAALTHPASQRHSQSNGDRGEPYTERERMLKGMYYYPNTPALAEDRERCISALWRFNNATNPSHGASMEERLRLFRQIIALRPTPEPPLSSGEVPPSNFQQPFGTCGERVIVEAPFHCTYGYNINIGDDVLIGPECRITDTCAVTIGARTILSPGVKIICATHPIDPHRRQGASGPALGRNIVIEEDCWIGANTTILAGVKVGRSSTVGAGSLLHNDVPKFTVVAGNPAKVSRGIYESPDGF